MDAVLRRLAALAALLVPAALTLQVVTATASTLPRSGPAGTVGAAPHDSGQVPAGAFGDLFTVVNTVGQVGYVAAGVGMRNLGGGTISITGIPADATVRSATLIWDVVADQEDFSFRQGVFNGTPVTGTFEDFGNTPCWPPGVNISYQADVTALVAGNGSYVLSGFASGEDDGADPWQVGSEPPLLEGATLVVIYASPSAPQTAIQLDMGARETAQGNPASATLEGFTAAPGHGAMTTYIVGDGQEPGNSATFDGTTLADVAFPGADPQAVPGYSMGNLWDTVTRDVSSLVSPGDTSATLTVTGSDDCIVWVGQVLAVQEPPSVAVAAVRFAAAAASAPGTAGLPVIKDDGPSPVRDHASGPASCPDGLPSPRSYDYLDCAKPPGGSPAKVWPVIYVAGKKLTVSKAVFFATGQLTSPTLTATATIGDATLTLPPTSLTQTQVNGATELSAASLAFTGSLPATAGTDQLSITWTVTDGGNPLPAGTSTHPVYVTAAPYVAPAGTVVLPPYVTLLDVGTKAAQGLTGHKAVFKAIWAKFASRDIAHPILDPAAGTVSDGPDIKYYDNGYRTIGDWWTKVLGRCPMPQAALATNSAHCGNWAQFLTNMLSYQGIASSYVGLGNSPDFYPGPEPTAGRRADRYAYMLVGPALWSFTSKNADAPYAYADPVTVHGTVMTVAPRHVRYHPSGTAIAQGLVTTPPELFYTGDHAIVRTPWGYVDPSYGTPQGSTPYKTLSDYERAAIAGFAVIYDRQADGTFAPLSLRSPQDVVAQCGITACEFRAVPYSQSGAPAMTWHG